MTKIETIIAEIKRLKAEAFNNFKNRSLVTDVANSQRIAICEQLLHFINSLPEDQPNEDLEKEIDRVVKEVVTPEVLQDYIAGFKAGAQWQKEQLINKACEWLNKNVVEYHPRTGTLKPVVNLNAFREAMEKEDEQ